MFEPVYALDVAVAYRGKTIIRIGKTIRLFPLAFTTVNIIIIIIIVTF